MMLAEAREFVGRVCAIRWQDRAGREQQVVSKIYDATYVPLYGGYLITDTEDIRLDRINCVEIADESVPMPIMTFAHAEQVAA